MQKSRLRISIQNLPSEIIENFDQVVVSEKETGNNKWVEIGSTEYVKYDKNPIFVRTVPIVYFNINKLLRFQIVEKSPNLSTSFGTFTFCSVDINLYEILQGKSVEKIKLKTTYGEKYLTNYSEKHSTITVEAEPFKTSIANFTFRVRGYKLSKKDFFSSYPYFIITRTIKNKGCIVYTSEIIKKNLNPQWNLCTLSLLDMCDNKKNAVLTFWCYDHKKIIFDNFIGTFKFSVNEILIGKKIFQLMHPRKKSSRGIIEFQEASLKSIYNFEDFCKAGLDFNKFVCVDFSASNFTLTGDVHARNGEYFNSMQLSLNALSQFDSDQQFSVWGFSAILKGKMNNCFSITSYQGKKVNTVPNVMDAYQHALTQVERGNSKDISGVLIRLLNIVRKEVLTDKSKYYVLFLFTLDGKIEFLEKTKNILAQLSKLPVSIIFIGVGSGKFSDFSTLDEDWKKFKERNGIYSRRDCVSLLYYRSFFNLKMNAKQVSDEIYAFIYKTIRKQSLNYFRRNNLTPKIIKDSVNKKKEISSPYGCQNTNKQPHGPQNNVPQQSGNDPQRNMQQPNIMQPQSLGQYSNNNYNNQGKHPNNIHPMNPKDYQNNLQRTQYRQSQYGEDIRKQQFGNSLQCQNQLQPQSLGYNQVKTPNMHSSNQSINNKNEKNSGDEREYSLQVPLKNVNSNGGNDIKKIENQMSNINLGNEANEHLKNVPKTKQPPINPNYYSAE